MYSSECDYSKSCEYDRYITQKHRYIQSFVLTKTAANREIKGYAIGSENGLIICGAFHGMERITAAMLYRFLDDVCNNMSHDKIVRSKILSKGLCVIPMMNPDGVQISIHGPKTAGKFFCHVQNIIHREKISHKNWQANARGVDLNHNFDAGYDVVKKHEQENNIHTYSSTRYGGRPAESENETKALCDLCRKNSYKMCVALHSQGREIYYDFDTHTPKNSLCVANKLSALSSYKVSHPQTIAVGGGFKDWFIQEFNRMGFTIEVGKGTNPLSPKVFDTEYPYVYKMLWHLLINE